MGVFAPLVGIVGATQAAEALKLIAAGGPLARRPPAAARRADDGLARGARAARSGVSGVRDAGAMSGVVPARWSVSACDGATRRRAALACWLRRRGVPRKPHRRAAEWKAIQQVIAAQRAALIAGDADKAFALRLARHPAAVRRRRKLPRDGRCGLCRARVARATSNFWKARSSTASSSSRCA